MDPTYLDYYRSSPDWVKAVWVLSLPAFFIGMSWIAAHYGLALLRLERQPRAPAAREVQTVSD